MRSLLLDELSSQDVAKVRQYLEEQATASGLEDLYWIELAPELLADLQAAHHHCQPHRFAVEVGQDFVKLELLIRPADSLRCECGAYASHEQRGFILETADRMVAELGLRT